MDQKNKPGAVVSLWRALLDVSEVAVANRYAAPWLKAAPVAAGPVSRAATPAMACPSPC